MWPARCRPFESFDSLRMRLSADAHATTARVHCRPGWFYLALKGSKGLLSDFPAPPSFRPAAGVPSPTRREGRGQRESGIVWWEMGEAHSRVMCGRSKLRPYGGKAARRTATLAANSHR